MPSSVRSWICRFRNTSCSRSGAVKNTIYTWILINRDARAQLTTLLASIDGIQGALFTSKRLNVLLGKSQNSVFDVLRAGGTVVQLNFNQVDAPQEAEEDQQNASSVRRQSNCSPSHLWRSCSSFIRLGAVERKGSWFSCRRACFHWVAADHCDGRRNICPDATISTRSRTIIDAGKQWVATEAGNPK